MQPMNKWRQKSSKPCAVECRVQSILERRDDHKASGCPLQKADSTATAKGEKPSPRLPPQPHSTQPENSFLWEQSCKWKRNTENFFSCSVTVVLKRQLAANAVIHSSAPTAVAHAALARPSAQLAPCSQVSFSSASCPVQSMCWVARFYFHSKK